MLQAFIHYISAFITPASSSSFFELALRGTASCSAPVSPLELLHRYRSNLGFGYIYVSRSQTSVVICQPWYYRCIVWVGKKKWRVFRLWICHRPLVSTSMKSAWGNASASRKASRYFYRISKSWVMSSYQTSSGSRFPYQDLKDLKAQLYSAAQQFEQSHNQHHRRHMWNLEPWNQVASVSKLPYSCLIIVFLSETTKTQGAEHGEGVRDKSLGQLGWSLGFPRI